MKINKKFLAALMALCLAVCLFTTTAVADKGDKAEETTAAEETLEETSEEPEETEATEEPEKLEEETEADEADIEGETEAEEEAEPVFVEEAEVYFNNGELVFNNGGVVYNNGGEVYNNGGTVYNNLGTVYNNNGTVYNNNGTVYANDGSVYTNGGEVIDPVLVEDPKIEVTENAELYADITGLVMDEDGVFMLENEEEPVITVAAKPGFELTEVDCDAGMVEENDGVYTITEIGQSCTLTVEGRAAAPVLSLESGTYSEKHKLNIEAADDAVIYYTLNGSEPDENSSVYENTLSISKSTVIKAVAIVDGVKSSEAATGEYAFVEITAPKFDSLEADYEQPDAKAFIIENKGKVNAVIKSVTLSGDDVESFIFENEMGGNVEAESTDNTTWTIQPQEGLEEGTYKVTVTFTFDSGDTVEFTVSFRVK